MYAALHCKSNYSFLEGASHPSELVTRSHKLGLKAIALTDTDGVYGMVRAHVKAKELGVQLIVGATVSTQESSIVLLAENRTGYGNLCELLSIGRLRSDKGHSLVSNDEIYRLSKGLIAVWDGSKKVSREELCWDDLTAAFANRLYVKVSRHLQAGDKEREYNLTNISNRYDIPVVAANEVLYHEKGRKELQDVLTCIRHGVPLHRAGTLIRINEEHDLKSPRVMQERFYDNPDALKQTLEISERCLFSLGSLHYRYPAEKLGNGHTSASWLRHLVAEGVGKRYGQNVPTEVRAQVEKELLLIEELEYGGYFLTMYEIVEFCRRENILCQGRGSAANSAVCYSLGITAVDPVKMGLLFERFLSRERAEPPDIDLDIEHNRREEVIQHVYRKYGRKYAAMVCNFIRYRPKSAVRDVGKALGVPETALDRLAKILSRASSLEANVMRDAGFDPDAPLHSHLQRLANEVLDFPRHLSIHSGGFLLGHEPVQRLVPIENATMPGRTVIQWDKDDLESLFLFKVDLLALGALHQVHRCFDLIRKHRGRELSMATIPSDDKSTFEMICRADTVGTFQIESRAQMSMLPRLRPKEFYDLVIEISIVRPGPIAGGMVHPYLRRRNGEEAIDYPHEALRPVLERTLGIPLFQEQVMRLAIVAANYTPGEADQLRRDMAAWRRSGRIEKHHDRLVTRMQEKGIKLEFAERVFEQIRGFGEYGFPESHAASFALIAYVTCFLKCHYPAEFACSLLNAQPMGFYSPGTIVEDAKRHEVEIRPVDVTQSSEDCTLERTDDGEFAIRMGLRYVSGLSSRERGRILSSRNAGDFASLTDFVHRTRLSSRGQSLLAESGALACFGGSRRHALWQVEGCERAQDDTLRVGNPEPVTTFPELDQLDTILWDYRTSSHSATGHPLLPLRKALSERGFPSASELAQMKNGWRIRYAGIVICRQRPGTAGGVTFMTLEDETGFVNLVIWRRVFEEFSLLVKTASFLGVSGRLQSKDGVVHLVADSLWHPDLDRKPERSHSRDFH